MKEHKHNWKETTLSRDGYGDTISFACECGMWKVETLPVRSTFVKEITGYRIHGKSYDLDGN